jgi:excisionase family DNA binding protein
MVEEAIKTVVSDVVRQVLREELQALQPPPPAEQTLLNLRKASELVGVSVSKLKQWVRSGALTRYGAGRIVRISKAELLAHLAPKPVKHVDKEALNQWAAQHLARRTP